MAAINPAAAGLWRGYSFGFTATWHSRSIRFSDATSGTSDAAIADSVETSAPTNGWPSGLPRPVATSALPTRKTASDPSFVDAQFSISLLPFNKDGKNQKWGVSIFGQTPIGTIQTSTVQYYDTRAQFFDNELSFFRQTNNRGLDIGAAIAYQASRTLRVGVGAWLNQNIETNTDIDVRDVLLPDAALQQLTTNVSPAVSATFGIWWTPIPSISVSGSFQTRRANQLEVKSKVDTPIQDGSGQVWQAYLQYAPPRADVSLLWKVPPNMEASIGGTWSQWSDYQLPDGDIPDPALQDTVSLSLALRNNTPDWAWSSSVTWQPTPTQQQQANTNLVDNDRLITGLSISKRISQWSIGIDAALFWQLQNRHTKDDSLLIDEFPDDSFTPNGTPDPNAAGLQSNNPGFPGFSSKGFSGTFGVFVEKSLP